MAMLLPSFFSLSSSSPPPLSLSLPLPFQAFSLEEVEGIWAWLLLGVALFFSFAIPCSAAAQSFRCRWPCPTSGCSEKLLNTPAESRRKSGVPRRRKLGADSSRGSHSHGHRISPTLVPGKRVVSNQTLLQLRQTLLVGPDQPEALSDSRRILTMTTVPDSHPCRIMLRPNRSPPAPGIAESLCILDSRPSIVRSDVSPFLTQLRNRRSRPAASGFVINESELIDLQTDWCLPRLARKSQQVVHRRRSTKFPADTTAQHKTIGSVSSSSSSSSTAVTLLCLTDSRSSCSDQKGLKQADCAASLAGSIEVRSSDMIQAADSIADSEKQVMKEATKIEETVYALPSSSSTVTTSGLADSMDSYSGRKDSKRTDCVVDLTDSIPLGNSDTLQVTDLVVDLGQQIMKKATQTEEAANALPSSSSSLVKTSGVIDPKSSFDDQNDSKRTGYVVDRVDLMMISSSEAESVQIGNAITVQASDSIEASEQRIAKETIQAEETVDASPSSSSGEILSLTDSSSSHNNYWEGLKQIDCAYSVSLCTVDVADLTKINAASCNCETDLTAIQIANTIIREATDSEEWMVKEVGWAGRIIGASPSSSSSSMKMQNSTDLWNSNRQGVFKQISYAADVADSKTTSSFCKHEADSTQVRNADSMHEATDLGQWIVKGANQTKETPDSLSSSLPSMKVPSLVDSQSYHNNRGELKQINHVCSQDNPSGLIEQSFSCQTRNEFIGSIEASLPQIDLMVGGISAETEANRSNSSLIDVISLPEIVETAHISTAESANPSCLLCSKSEEKSGTVTAVSSSWLEVGIEQAGKSLSSSTIIETADEGESEMCLDNGDEGILSDPQTWWDEDAILIEPETLDPKEWNDAPPRLIGDWFLF